MAKSIKIILSITAVMIFLTALAFFTLPFYIDPSSFKPKIASAVKNKIGRDLTLTGDLKISLFPWLGLSTGKMTIGNPIGFQDTSFASIEESTIKINLSALLSKKIEVSHLTLKGLTLNLTKNSEGKNNWADFIASNTATTTATTSVVSQSKDAIIPASKVDIVPIISDVTIENALINWDDQTSGTKRLINNINLTSHKFSYDAPTPIDLSLSTINPLSKAIESIKLTTQLTTDKNFEALVFSHSELLLSTEQEKKPDTALWATVTIDDVTMNTPQQTLKVSGLALKSTGLSLTAGISGRSIYSKPSFQGSVNIAPFNPIAAFQQFGNTPSNKPDTQSSSTASASFNWLQTEDTLELQDLAISLDDSKILGSIHISQFSQPIITTHLAIDKLDLDRYLPVPDNKIRPLTSPVITLAMGVSKLPMTVLSQLNINAQVTLDQLKINNMILQDVQLNSTEKGGLITMQQSAKKFYSGSYSGSVNIDMSSKKPSLTISENLTHVQVDPLLNDLKSKFPVSGTMDLSTQLQGQGSHIDEIRSSLTGHLNFLFKNSVIKGFNLQKIIDGGKALFKEPTPQINNKNDQTLFSEISGSATITNGVIENNDLLATSSKVQIKGKGKADLSTEKIDYKINAQLITKEASATEPAQLNAIPININVAGTFNNPIYTLDLASLLTEQNKAKIEQFVDKNQKKIDEIANKIDKKLGSKVGSLLKGLFNKKDH